MVRKMMINSSEMEETSQLRKIGGLDASEFIEECRNPATFASEEPPNQKCVEALPT
jgi:hypothetical protein